MNFYNHSIARRIAQQSKRRIETTAMAEKTLIVKGRQGREVSRSVIVAKAGDLHAEFEAARAHAVRRYPNHYYFCDRSEGTMIADAVA